MVLIYRKSFMQLYSIASDLRYNFFFIYISFQKLQKQFLIRNSNKNKRNSKNESSRTKKDKMIPQTISITKLDSLDSYNTFIIY